MLPLSALLSLAIAFVVGIGGEERGVKLWFLLLSVATAALSVGLWVEVALPAWSFAAARVNMTSALIIAICGTISVRTLYGLPLRAAVVALMVAGAAVNIATIWLTEAYFTGALLQYPWGVYVAGDPKFLANPLLVAAIAGVGLVNLWTEYRVAHPLDRNRAKYLLLANLAFAGAALDYLPHFGIDFFGGPVSGVCIPLFVAVYGYAMLRFRLFAFRSLAARGAGWVLAAILLGTSYALALELGWRLGLPLARTHLAAALLAFLLWLVLARQMPDWAHRLLSGEADFAAGLRGFAEAVIALPDEPALESRWSELCAITFGAARAWFVDGRHLSTADIPNAQILEREALRRAGARWPELAAEAELLLPLHRRGTLLGMVALGPRADGGMYSGAALDVLRQAANVFAAALTNIRAALELEKRHQLDRYLAPQIVDSVLGGASEAIERKRRMTITVFFSDIRHFSNLADRLDPDLLARVLNDYLSEMAESAFAHGGTLDKFIGDAVMVLFGAPVEDDPHDHVRRCLAMAAEMHRRIGRLNRTWREAGLLRHDVEVRMGINTGEATVGSFGSRTRVEYTAVGRNVNLASRLESECRPGRILVSAETWRLLAGGVRGEARGRISVKGFSELVEAYEIDPELAAGCAVLT